MAQASSRDTARNNGKQTGEVAAEAIDQTADHAHATTETLAAATEAASVSAQKEREKDSVFIMGPKFTAAARPTVR